MEVLVYTLKVGDLLEIDGKFGFIVKIRPKSFRYFICSNPTAAGAFFNCQKQEAYDAIDKNECKHHLVGNTTKYRRKRLRES